MKQLTVDLKGKWGGDIGQKIEAQRSIINVLGQPNYKNLQGLNEEGIRSAVGLTADFMHDVGRAFTARKQALSEDGYTINTVVGANGMITIQSPNAPSKDIDDLNKKYASAWNAGVKAVANMHNSTWNETSQLLSEQHGATWGFTPGTNPLQGAAPTKKTSAVTGTRGQNETNPGNIKIAGQDKFASFDSPAEGIKAIKSQLVKYRTGTSQHVKTLPGGKAETPAQMLAIYNNQAEKGSATDKQYLENISKHSGLSVEELNQPINPNDNETWNDLVYGIIRAEGNRVSARQVRLALGE